MTIFTPIEETKAKSKVKKVFDNIKKERKIKAIPNFWKTIANDPDTLERTWNSLKDIMKKGASIYSNAITTIKRKTVEEIIDWLEGYNIDSSWVKKSLKK